MPIGDVFADYTNGTLGGQDLTDLKIKRDTLVNDEVLSAEACTSTPPEPPPHMQMPNVLEGQCAELILKDMIYSFHSASFLVTNPDGVILIANTHAAAGFPNTTAESIIGKNLCDLAPKEWALERIGFMKLAIQRNHPLLIIEVLCGIRLCSTINPIKVPGENGPQWILLITVEQISPKKLQWLRNNKTPEILIDAMFIDLGPLAILTPRELEVIALMGHGLRQKQIAEKLHRSVSTIDRHRERIGEKLGITDRIELVTMAREAALEVADSTRTNTPFGHPHHKR